MPSCGPASSELFNSGEDNYPYLKKTCRYSDCTSIHARKGNSGTIKNACKFSFAICLSPHMMRGAMISESSWILSLTPSYSSQETYQGLEQICNTSLRSESRKNSSSSKVTNRRRRPSKPPMVAREAEPLASRRLFGIRGRGKFTALGKNQNVRTMRIRNSGTWAAQGYSERSIRASGVEFKD